jgi:hypothetical protein
MSELAITSYADNYYRLNAELRVWVGQTIAYCEDVNVRLGNE